MLVSGNLPVSVLKVCVSRENCSQVANGCQECVVIAASCSLTHALAVRGMMLFIARQIPYSSRAWRDAPSRPELETREAENFVLHMVLQTLWHDIMKVLEAEQ